MLRTIIRRKQEVARKVRLVSVPLAARRPAMRWRLPLLVVAATLVVPSLGAAQQEAPGEPVVIPGADIPDWGYVDTVPARSTAKVPAVLILHGGSGIDGRGAFYAKALQEAGLATLKITMFPRGGSPCGGTKAMMPHAEAALVAPFLVHVRSCQRKELPIGGLASEPDINLRPRSLYPPLT